MHQEVLLLQITFTLCRICAATLSARPLFHGFTNLDVCHTVFKSVLSPPSLIRPARGIMAVLLLEICFLIAGRGREVVLLFSCEIELIWCRCSRRSLSRGTWGRHWWGEAFSITCLCIPRGTEDKEALSCGAKLSCFEKENRQTFLY